MMKRPDGHAVGAFDRPRSDQVIANTTVTVAETSCEPGWIGVAASAAANRPSAPPYMIGEAGLVSVIETTDPSERWAAVAIAAALAWAAAIAETRASLRALAGS